MHPLAKLALVQLQGPRFYKADMVPKTAFLISTSYNKCDFYWSPECRHIYNHCGGNISLDGPPYSIFEELKDFVRQLETALIESKSLSKKRDPHDQNRFPFSPHGF